MISLLIISLILVISLVINTQQKRLIQSAKEQMERTTEVKNNLTSLFLHDLRSPLAILKNVSMLLQDRSLMEDNKAELLALIDDSSEKINRLSYEVIRLQQSSQIQIGHEVIDLQSLLSGIVKKYQKMASAHIILDTRAIEGKKPAVLGDEFILGQVIENLIINAIKYGHPEQPIRVSAFLENDQLVLSVRDQGPGLSPEILEVIIEDKPIPLQTASEVEKGLGLGLKLCHKMVQAMQGALVIFSEVGKGTDIQIKLNYQYG